jgi:PEP-CTERM motif-containing protein
MRKALAVTLVLIAGIVLSYPRDCFALSIFSLADAGAGPADPRPNSNFAAASFAAAAATLGPINTITFENLPTGFTNPLGVAPGVIATFSGAFDAVSSPSLIGVTTNSSTPTVLGYNTTVGGSKYLGFVPQFVASPATLTFSFSTPINAFGAYITGLEDGIAGVVNVQFNDGSPQSFLLSDPIGGGVQFFGFTDAGHAISAVSFVETGVSASSSRDIWGIDDMSFSVTPEPGTLLLLGSSLAGLGLLWRRTQKLNHKPGETLEP